MNLELIRDFLLGCLIVNYAVLMIWFVAFVLGRRWMKALHGRWFRLGDEAFDAVHYGGMAVYKIGILLFNLVPLIVLHFGIDG